MQNQIRKIIQKNLRQTSNSGVFSNYLRVQPMSFKYSKTQQENNNSNKAQVFAFIAGAASLGYFSKKYFMSSLILNQSKSVAFADGTELVEFEIDFASTLEEGQTKGLKVGPKDEDKVLVVKYQGKIYVIGNSCPHFGAPLDTGFLFDDKIVCPWHGASFSILTGALNGGPSLEGVPKYEVYERKGKVYTKVPAVLPKGETEPMAKRDPADKRRFVIVGGGAAGLTCAETLRQSNFTGEITVISAEDILPYDRTLLTKALATIDGSKLGLRPSEFLSKADIDYKLNVKADKVDPKSKSVTLSTGEVIHYDKLLIATGGTPRTPRFDSGDLKGIEVLRNYHDQDKIKTAAAQAKSVAIIGIGFIGSEAASGLKLKYKESLEVHLIGREEIPLENVLGKEVGQSIANEHKANGVTLHMKTDVRGFKGENGHVTSVVLDNGTEIKADLVIIGAGVAPTTTFLKDSGIELDYSGGVVADPFLQTSEKDIFVAGDIASFPYWPTGGRLRVEHWVTAQDQGSYAAFNMLGKLVPYDRIPFFWTRHYNKTIQYTGFSNKPDEIFVQGDTSANKFVAYYVKNGKVTAIAAQQSSGAFFTLQEALAQNVMPLAEDIKTGKETIQTIQARLKQTKGGKCTREHCCQKKPASV